MSVFILDDLFRCIIYSMRFNLERLIDMVIRLILFDWEFLLLFLNSELFVLLQNKTKNWMLDTWFGNSYELCRSALLTCIYMDKPLLSLGLLNFTCNGELAILVTFLYHMPVP